MQDDIISRMIMYWFHHIKMSRYWLYSSICRKNRKYQEKDGRTERKTLVTMTSQGWKYYCVLLQMLCGEPLNNERPPSHSKPNGLHETRDGTQLNCTVAKCCHRSTDNNFMKMCSSYFPYIVSISYRSSIQLCFYGDNLNWSEAGKWSTFPSICLHTNFQDIPLTFCHLNSA